MPSFLNPLPDPPTSLGRYRILSPTASIRVSPLCLGSMSIGDAWSHWLGGMDKEKSFELLDAFVAAGGNFIDTASSYQDEQSEIWLGEWMESRGNRDRIDLATKFGNDYRGWEIGKDPSVNQSGTGKKSMHISVRDSLTKIRTDYIDILYVHWWDWTTSIPELMDALDALVKSGKVLYLGISDTPAWIVSGCNEYAKAHGKTVFSIYQGQWNVMTRDFEREILPMARQHGMALAPWNAMGGGRIKSKDEYEIDANKASGEPFRNLDGAVALTEEKEKFSLVLDSIAQELGLKSPTAVALAYLMSKAPYVFPIVGGRKVEYLHDNISALTVTLSDAQVKAIEDVKPFDLGFPSNFVGDNPSNHKGKHGGIMLATIGHLDFVHGPSPIMLEK